MVLSVLLGRIYGLAPYVSVSFPVAASTISASRSYLPVAPPLLETGRMLLFVWGAEQQAAVVAMAEQRQD